MTSTRAGVGRAGEPLPCRSLREAEVDAAHCAGAPKTSRAPFRRPAAVKKAKKKT